MHNQQSLRWRLYLLFLALRSILFWLVFMPSVIFFALLLTLVFFTSLDFKILLIRSWINLNLFCLKYICGLDYQIEGLENIPDHGFIVMSKHASTWETIALQKFFAPMVWVVKRELLHVPFFGWGLWSMDAIAINRGTGRQAIKQLTDQGIARMREGRIVMLFPEGTRVLPGQYKPFKLGGAILAHDSGHAILPIAHNAGEFWPRHSLIKWPGTIKVVIGKPIEPGDDVPEQIIKRVEEWVLGTCEQISDQKQLQRLGLVQPD